MRSASGQSIRKSGAGSPAGVSPVITGLEKWEAAVGESVDEDFLQTVVLADPNFPLAHRQAVLGALDYAIGHADFQATASDMGQYFLCSIALYMDVTGGLTHRRLRALMGDSGVISAGRASALLWRLRLGRFIEPADGDAGRGLLKRFVPTMAMRHAFRERMRIDLGVLPGIDPAIGALLQRLDEPVVQDAVIRESGDAMITSATRPDPRLETFHLVAARTAGVLILYHLVASVEGEDAAFPACGMAAASVAGLARRYNVSRSHVLSLLRQMQKAGFIAFDPTGGGAVVQPLLRDTLRLFYGVVVTGQLRAAHRVLLAVQAEDRAGG